jgi:hypothetical protein
MQSDEQSLGSSELSQQRHARITSRAKTDAVLRLLNGESVERVSQEFGVTVGRIERWKSRFVEAGSAELAKRQDIPSKSWGLKHWGTIRQWLFLLIALVAVITLLVVLMQRGSPQ